MSGTPEDDGRPRFSQPGTGLDPEYLLAMVDEDRHLIFETLPEAVRRAYNEQAEAAASAKNDEEAKEALKSVMRRQMDAADEVRREREEAQISGRLTADAQAFFDLRLKPGLTEAADFTPETTVPIVQGVFNRNSLSWVAGPSGTFKSFVTADLAFRYGSDDMDFHGRKMTHGRALIVVAEGAAGYAHRKTAWEKQHGRKVENVTIFPAPLQLADTIKEMPALIHHLRQEEEAGRPYGLIIIDTQAMCTVGVDENKSEMNLVINVLHRLREVSGACVLTVHHFGKNERSGMRGSSMLYAAADTVCILKRKDDAVEVTLSTAQSDEGKQKDTGGEKDFLTLELKAHPVGEDYFGDPVFSLCPVPGALSHDPEPGEAPPAPASLPVLSEVDMYYLRGIDTYESDGASPSALRERLNSPEYLSSIPRPDHSVKAQTAGNRLQGLRKKGLTEPVPGARGKWRATPLGVAVIANHMIDRARIEADWSDRNARRGAYRGAHTAGLDEDQTLGSSHGSEGVSNHDPEPN